MHIKTKLNTISTVLTTILQINISTVWEKAVLSVVTLSPWCWKFKNGLLWITNKHVLLFRYCKWWEYEKAFDISGYTQLQIVRLKSLLGNHKCSILRFWLFRPEICVKTTKYIWTQLPYVSIQPSVLRLAYYINRKAWATL